MRGWIDPPMFTGSFVTIDGPLIYDWFAAWRTAPVVDHDPGDEDRSSR